MIESYYILDWQYHCLGIGGGKKIQTYGRQPGLTAYDVVSALVAVGQALIAIGTVLYRVGQFLYDLFVR